MGIATQGQVLPSKGLSRGTQIEVARETENIKHNWRRTVESILKIGKSLERIKKLLPHGDFTHHIRQELGLGEMQANRFRQVYKKFGSHKARTLLSAKPSVLYILAASPHLGKVETLARGGAISINGKKKTIDALSIADALKLKSDSGTTTRELTDHEIDRKRSEQAFEKLGELTQSLEDWARDLERFSKTGIAIPHRKLLVETLRESRHVIDSAIRVLS